MTSSQILSHTLTSASKPLVALPETAWHPKGELSALLAALPPDATASHVAVLVALWTHTNAEGQAWPGQERLSERARVCLRTTNEAIKYLEQAGLLVRRVPKLVKRHGRQTTQYRLPTVPRPRKAQPARAVLTEQQTPTPVTLAEPAQQQPTPAPAFVAAVSSGLQSSPPAQVQPAHVNHVQPLHAKYPREKLNQSSQNACARTRETPARSTAPTTPQPRRAPAPVLAALRSVVPDTGPVLAILRGWRAQLPLPFEESGAKAPRPKGEALTVA